MYTTKDIENRTNIPASAIRRYSSELEKLNYTFSKKGEQRYYFNKDLFLIKQIHKNFRESEKTIQEVAQLTLEQSKKNENAPITTTTDTHAIITAQNEKFEKFMDAIHSLSKQNEDIINLNQRLLKQKEETENELSVILGRLDKNERNRDVHLMSAIREIQETKKMIAASKQPSVFKRLKMNISRKFIEQ